MKYDAIISGAGPSGAFCALNLAKKGFNVLVIDKSKFPREKVCGGLISKKSMDLLGCDTLTKEIDSNNVNNICIRDETDKQINMESKSPMGIVVKRKEFDQFLIGGAIKAGAKFFDNCSFENCILEPGGYKVQTGKGVFYTDYIIGADGYYSKVAKLANIRNRWAGWERGIALSIQLPDKYIAEKRDNTVEFLLPDILAGLGWCFQGKGYYNIGVGGAAIDGRRVVDAFGHLLEQKIKDKSILSHLKYKAAFLPAGGRLRRISNGRIFLLGDAAGFVDPFSGEGIYYALRSAEILADIMNRNKDGKEFEKICYKTFLAEFRLSALLSISLGNKKNIFQRGLQERFLKAFYMIMTQTPENMCYKNIFHDLAAVSLSADIPILWLKRLILGRNEN